jgi:hypothetical protein
MFHQRGSFLFCSAQLANQSANWLDFVTGRSLFTLPSSSETRITASFDRLKNVAYPIALLIAFGSPYHRRPNGSALLIRSKPRCPVAAGRIPSDQE